MMQWRMAPPGMASASAEVLRRLEEAGHEAYWVGGCIRDELMGRPVHDMDITTSARPEEVMELFERCVPTGLVHGTVTVLAGGFGFEVTTYRTESGYEDYRRPGQVSFVRDVKEDLRRRDFTVNAICAGLDGMLIDPFGGADDLQARRIRCVGRAEERFEEDALRMLRCVRFASVLGFSVAYHTWRGLLRRRELLAHIAVERVYAELTRIVEGPHPARGLAMLTRSGLLARGKAPFPWTNDGLAAAAPSVASIGELSGARLRWALLFHALDTPADEAAGLMRAWTFPGTAATAAVRVLRVREAWTRMGEAAAAPAAAGALRRAWTAAALAHGAEAAAGWLDVLAALPPAAQAALPGPQPAGAAAALARRWLEAMPVRELGELAVGGREVLQALGRRPGPWLGGLLNRLLLEAALGEVANESGALLDYAIRMDADEAN